MHLPVMGDYLTIRKKEFNNTFGWVREEDKKPRPHQGWDIAAMVGTPVYAITNSVVEFIRRERKIKDKKGNWIDAPYGNEICISFNFKGKTLYAQYAHLRTIDVCQGQFLIEGEEIGIVGQTGNAKGQSLANAHLHFEVRTSAFAGEGLNGRLDPLTLFGTQPLLDIIFDDFPKIVK